MIKRYWVLLLLLTAKPPSDYISQRQYNFQLCKQNQYDRLRQQQLGF